MKTIYRGYDIERGSNGFTVSKDGAVLCEQPTEEVAQNWVDKDRREQAQKGK